MTRSRLPSTLFALALVTACTSPPPPPPPPPPAPAPVTPPTTATAPRERTFATRLGNGLALTVTEARPGDEAQLHLGFLVGASFVAPGLAELAVRTLVDGADASRGRPSLAHAIGQLGGFVEVAVGPLTSWVQIRVPPSRWRAAQAALLRALEAPALTRSQLERLRDEAVQARTAAIERDAIRAMAEALLLAETDTTAHVSALLDRDASEIGLFRARLHRPERALFALRVPGDPTAIGAAMSGGERDSLAAWAPATDAAPDPRLLTRTFQPGFYWSAEPQHQFAEVAWLQFLPSLARIDAPELYALHACVTLDGAGGRLERLARERGLGHVRWRSEFVRGADTFAMLLRAEVPQADVPRLQQLVQAARASLRDVPPNDSEFQLARRRAALTAGLGLLDDVTRQRVQATLAVVGGSVERFEQRLAQLGGPTTFDVRSTALAYLDLPSMFVAIGGTVPNDLPDVRRFTTLPPGLASPRDDDPTPQLVNAMPWIERASDAVGGARLLRRLVGYRSVARLSNPQAPEATETLEWRTDGNLQRTRDVLGQQIVTTLAGTRWTERFAEQVQALTPRDAALLHREMERHPLALLAACHRGTLAFATVAQRSVGDRDYMVLQATGDRFDRLRVHVDTISHLVRVVEVWETMPDGTVVHLQDAWSDYRTVAGLRVPFRRTTTQDDGQNRVEAVYSDWQPILSAP